MDANGVCSVGVSLRFEVRRMCWNEWKRCVAGEGKSVTVVMIVVSSWIVLRGKGWVGMQIP